MPAGFKLPTPIVRTCWLMLMLLVSTRSDAQTTANPAALRGPAPQLERTDPAAWSTNVRPNLRRVQLRFDQPMRPGFTDWIGRRSLMPDEFSLEDQISPDLRTQWMDVQLEPGRVYVFALNERGRRGVGFQNQQAVAMQPHFLVFRTSGPILFEHSPPEVVSTSPANNASDVNPAEFSGIAVTFDRPMMTDDHGFIIAVDGQLLRLDDTLFDWNEDATTCLLQLPLRPQSRYRVFLNSQRNIGFRAANRVPLWPIQFAFETGESSGEPAIPQTAFNAPPEIVLSTPAIWQQDVEPGPKRILLSFDQPMRPGQTDWLGRNQRGRFQQLRDTSPEGISEDQMSLWLDVELEPSTLYIFPLNERGRRGVGFQNTRGLTMQPRYLVFRTAGPVKPDEVSPQIESTNPVNGSIDLDPDRLGAVTVIFDQPMQRDSHGAILLANGGAVELGEDSCTWSSDGAAFSVRIDWQPGTEYTLILNNETSIGFANTDGIPLWGTRIRFTTSSSSEDEGNN